MSAVHDQQLRREGLIIIESPVGAFIMYVPYKISNRKPNWHEKHQTLMLIYCILLKPYMKLSPKRRQALEESMRI